MSGVLYWELVRGPMWATGSKGSRSRVAPGCLKECWLLCNGPAAHRNSCSRPGPWKPKPGSHLWKKSSMVEPLRHLNRPKIPHQSPTIPLTISSWSTRAESGPYTDSCNVPAYFSLIFIIQYHILNISYILYICYIMYYIFTYMYILYILHLTHTLYKSSPSSHKESITLIFSQQPYLDIGS